MDDRKECQTFMKVPRLSDRGAEISVQKVSRVLWTPKAFVRLNQSPSLFFLRIRSCDSLSSLGAALRSLKLRIWAMHRRHRAFLPKTTRPGDLVNEEIITRWDEVVGWCIVGYTRAKTHRSSDSFVSRVLRADWCRRISLGGNPSRHQREGTGNQHAGSARALAALGNRLYDRRIGSKNLPIAGVIKFPVFWFVEFCDFFIHQIFLIFYQSDFPVF